MDFAVEAASDGFRESEADICNLDRITPTERRDILELNCLTPVECGDSSTMYLRLQPPRSLSSVTLLRHDQLSAPCCGISMIPF